MQKQGIWTMATLGLLGALACSSAPGERAAAADNGGATGGSRIATRLAVTSHSPAARAARRALQGRQLAYKIGSASAAELQSLQYYLTSIVICQDMEINGSGFSNASGCIPLYEGPEDPVLNSRSGPPQMPPDYAGQASYARQHPALAGYIDLTDPNSLNKLAAPTLLTARHVGKYKYGSVGWAYPVKVQAQISDANGNPLMVTHDGNTFLSGPPGAQGPVTLADQNFALGGVPELATVPLPNGGSWFKFQQPFEITQADIDNQAQFDLDLTFNADGIVYGYGLASASAGTFVDGPLNGNAVNTLNVPMLDLTPVPRRSTQVAVKETYIGTVAAGTSARFDMRVEFYSLQGDANRTILGVSTAPLVNAATPAEQISFGKAFSITTHADGAIDLLDWSMTPYLSGFVRGAQVGDTTTASVACSMRGPGNTSYPVYGGCTGDRFDVTFELRAISAVD